MSSSRMMSPNDDEDDWKPLHPNEMIQIPKSKIPKRQILNQENLSKEKDIEQEITQKIDKMQFVSEQDNTVHEKELKQRLDKIEKMNTYKQSKNLGDMPKVFAFEVENNIRNVMREVLKPVIGQNEKVVLNITDLQQLFQEIQINLVQLNKKLDSQISLTDQVKDANQKTKNMKDEYYREIQKLEKEISQNKQLLGVHDIKIGKINDERNLIFESRDKLKKDMREFEKLCQDFTKYSADQNKNLEEKIQSEIVSINIEVDRLQRNNDEFKNVQRLQKKHYESLTTNINVISNKLDFQQKSIWKLESLENIVRENERFIGYVQPMRVQDLIYKTINEVVKTKEQKLSLYEYQKEKLLHLIEDMNQADQKVQELKSKQKDDFVNHVLHGYNKVKYQNPEDFDERISELKQAILDEENEELEAQNEELQKQEKQNQKQPLQTSQNQKQFQTNIPQKQLDNKPIERNKTQPPQKVDTIATPQKDDMKTFQKNGQSQKTSLQISNQNIEEINQKNEISQKEIPKEKQSQNKQQIQNEKIQDKKIEQKNEKKEDKKIDQKQIINETKQKLTESKRSIQSQTQSIIQKQVQLKLTDLNITSKQIYMFASRIGRRLLKNQKFLDKLAKSLDDADVTDYSETAEENWGKGNDQDDLKGYTYQKIQKNIQYSESEKANDNSNKKQNEKELQQSNSKVESAVIQEIESKEHQNNEEKVSEKQQNKQNESQISVQNQNQKSKLSSIQASENQIIHQSVKNESISLNRSQDTSSKQSKIIYDQVECNRIQQNASQNQQLMKSSDLSSQNNPFRNVSNKSTIQEKQIIRDSTFTLIKEQNQIEEKKVYPIENQNFMNDQKQINDQQISIINSQNIEINEIKQRLDAYKRKFENIEKLLQKRDFQQVKPQIVKKESEKKVKQNEPMKKIIKKSVIDSQVQFKESSANEDLNKSIKSKSESSLSSNIYNKKTKHYSSQASVVLDLQSQKIEELEKEMRDVQKFIRFFQNKFNLNDQVDQSLNSFDHEKWTFEQQQKQQSAGYMQKMFDERIEQMELLKNQMKIELKRLIRQDFQVQQKFDILNQGMKQTNQMQDGISNRIGLCESSLAIVFKLMRISYALAHQDEMDRQDVFLMGGKISGGLQDNQGNPNINQSLQEQSIDQELQSIISHQETARPKKQQQPVQPTFQGMNMPQVISTNHKNHKLLQFDTNCLTCAHGKGSSQIPSLFKAFKIACLSYKPSPVLFDNKMYERNQLVEAHGCLLILALKQMKHLDFNSVDNALLGATSEQALEQNIKYNQELKIQFDDLLSNSINSDNNNILERNQKKKIQQSNLTPIQMKKINLGENLTSNNFNQQIALEQQNLRGSNFFGFLQNYDNEFLIGDQKQLNSARSKEYTKLASQIPSVYLVKNGKIEINNQNVSFNSNQTKKQTNQRYLKSINKKDQSIETTNQSLNIQKMPDEQKWNVKIEQKKKKDPQNLNQSLQSANINDIHQFHSVLTPTQFPNQKNIFNFNTINVVGSQNSVSPNNLIFSINQHAQPTSNSRVKGGRVFSIDNQQEQKPPKNLSLYQPNQQSIQNFAAQIHRPPLVTAGGQLQSSRINQHFNNRNNMAFNTTQQNDISLPSVLIPNVNLKNVNVPKDQINSNIRQSLANFSQSVTEGIFSNDS